MVGVLGGLIPVVASFFLVQYFSRPVIEEFSADRTTIAPGQNTNLSWRITGQWTASIKHGAESWEIGHQGYKPVSPEDTTTYELVADGLLPIKPAERMVEILVLVRPNDPAFPIIQRFDADELKIDRGDATTLRWDVKNATRVEICRRLESWIRAGR